MSAPVLTTTMKADLDRIDMARYRERPHAWTCPGAPDLPRARIRVLIEADLAFTYRTEFGTVFVRPNANGRAMLAEIRQRRRA